jgi:hypothetical protein
MRLLQIMTLLTYLHEPDSSGRQLSGVLFMTHKPSMPANWTSRATTFWRRVNATCTPVVTEHFHNHAFVCSNSEAALGRHFFALRNWLNNSGDPAKMTIANRKFTVMHSARYSKGPTDGNDPNPWRGADSDVVSLDAFRRNLSKCTKVTRTHAGGMNRIAFAPITDNSTDLRIHTRIRRLIRWHYNQNGSARELLCLGGNQANCAC